MWVLYLIIYKIFTYDLEFMKNLPNLKHEILCILWYNYTQYFIKNFNVHNMAYKIQGIDAE